MYWPPTHTLTDRFASVIEGLCGVVRAQAGRTEMATLLLTVLWNRLRRICRRFNERAAQVRDGTVPAIVPARPRAVASRTAASRSPAGGLPRQFGWLLRSMPEPWHVAHWRNLLEGMFSDPEMAAVIAGAPQVGRELRPLCWMLAIKPPPGLALPRRPRRPRLKPAKKPLTPEQVDAKVARMSRMAYANMINPNDPDPLGIRPPNRIGYGRPKPLPKPG